MASGTPEARSGRRALRRSWWPWLPLLVVLVVTLVIGSFGSTGPATNADRTIAIAKTLRCPICNGETVAESNADVSQQIRVTIAEQVEQGRSDDDIRAFVAQKFGDQVLLTPTGSGLVGLVWITPVVVLVVALAGLVLAFRRWGERAPVRTTEADRELVAHALDDRHHESDSTATATAAATAGEPAVDGAGTDR
jgi:cytochrome c-type biogenesis protein CcmH